MATWRALSLPFEIGFVKLFGDSITAHEPSMLHVRRAQVCLRETIDVPFILLMLCDLGHEATNNSWSNLPLKAIESHRI
jgi:hypothetical protein